MVTCQQHVFPGSDPAKPVASGRTGSGYAPVRPSVHLSVFPVETRKYTCTYASIIPGTAGKL